MAQGWNLDPITGDYVMVNGSPEQTNSLKLPAYYRLRTKRQTWLYAPDNNYGSDFFAILKRPSTNSNTRIEQIGARALQPMVDDGRAVEIEVETVENKRDATALKVTIIDASGQADVLTFLGLGV